MKKMNSEEDWRIFTTESLMENRRILMEKKIYFFRIIAETQAERGFPDMVADNFEFNLPSMYIREGDRDIGCFEPTKLQKSTLFDNEFKHRLVITARFDSFDWKDENDRNMLIRHGIRVLGIVQDYLVKSPLTKNLFPFFITVKDMLSNQWWRPIDWPRGEGVWKVFHKMVVLP